MKHRDRLSLFERLAQAVEVGTHEHFQTGPDGTQCWLWSGSRCNKGYGHIRVAGKTMRVHIAAWELVKGRKVRRGYTLDHGCRNPACWRPSHMEEVTRAVNTARGNRANPRDTSAARDALALANATRKIKAGERVFPAPPVVYTKRYPNGVVLKPRCACGGTVVCGCPQS